MFFGSQATSRNPKILYNSYINDEYRFIKLLKIFYKNWIIKNKTVIFALLLVTLLITVTCSMKPELHKQQFAVLKDKPIDTADTDTVNIVASKLVNDSIEVSLSEFKTIDDIKNLVLEEAGVRIPNSLPDEHLRIMYDQAIDKDIPITIFFRWIYTESLFKKNSTSSAGAIGYTQLMPSTYTTYRKKLKLTRGATNNIKIGAYYLKEMYDYWSKRKENEKLRWSLALASYHGNMSRIKNTVPKRSAKYVNFILQNGYE